MNYSKLFHTALVISWKHKFLWWFIGMPMLITFFFGYLFLTLKLNLILKKIEDFSNQSQLSYDFVKEFMESLLSSLWILLPLLLLVFIIVIISENALIKCIQQIYAGKKTNLSYGLKFAAGIFGKTLLLFLTFVLFFVAVGWLEYFIRGMFDHNLLITIASFIIQFLFLLLVLFALHYLVINRENVITCYKKSLVLSLKNIFHVIGLLVFIFLVSFIFLALFGFSAGISIYISNLLGLFFSMIFVLLVIPVSVFVVALWTLFFIELSPKNNGI